MNTGTQSTQPEATRVTDPTGNVRSVLHLPYAKHQTNSIRQSQQIHLPRLWTDTKSRPLCEDQTTTTKHRINRQTTITTQTNRHTVDHRHNKGADSKFFTTINNQSTARPQQTKNTHHTTTNQATTTNTTKSPSKDHKLARRLRTQTTKERPRTHQETTVEYPRQGEQNTINNRKRHKTTEHKRTKLAGTETPKRTNLGEAKKPTHKNTKTKETRTIEHIGNNPETTKTPKRRGINTEHNRGHVIPKHRRTNTGQARRRREPKHIGTNKGEIREHIPLEQRGASTQETNEHKALKPTKHTKQNTTGNTNTHTPLVTEHRIIKTRQKRRTKRAKLALIRNNQKRIDMNKIKDFRKLYNENRGDNIVKFFDEFEAWCNRLGRDDDSKTTALMKCLNKPTRQIYQDLTELVPQSYQSIKEDLITSHTGPKINIWKNPPEKEKGSPQGNDSIMKKTTVITPPDIKKSVTFKAGLPDYIQECTNHNNPEQQWVDPLGTRSPTKLNENDANDHPPKDKWDPSPDKEKDGQQDKRQEGPTKQQTTDTGTTMTTTSARLDIGTRTTPTWRRHDSYDRPDNTPTVPYRPHTPYCTHCYKNGHSSQTCHKLIGYPPHHQFGRTNREHHERTGFQRRHWDKEHKSEQPSATPIRGTEDQPTQHTNTTHHHDSTIKQSITDRTYTKTKEILSTITDRLANPQQRKAMMPIYILIMAGIGALLGQTITSLAASSSQIISALGTGMKDTFHGIRDLDGSTWRTISNATLNIITAGTTGISIVVDTTGGPNGIILYSLVLLLYIYLIYNKIKDSPIPARGLADYDNSSRKENLGSPHPAKEYELLDINTKTLNPNSEIFWPMTQGPRPNTNEIWKPRGKVNPTLV